jgi:hypothetical protein
MNLKRWSYNFDFNGDLAESYPWNGYAVRCERRNGVFWEGNLQDCHEDGKPELLSANEGVGV